MRYRVFAAAALLWFAAAPSQSHAQFVVAPNGNAATEGSALISGPLQIGGITYQFVFASSQFSAFSSGTSLTSIGFRLNAGQITVSTPLTFANYQITLSQPAQPFPTLNSVFASNIGAGSVLVRNGALTIPANALVGGAGPNPFYDIAFNTPYVYTGGDLLVTLSHTGNGTANPLTDGGSLSDGNSNTVLFNSFGATTGTADIFTYPIARFGTLVPEPGPLAFLVGMGASGAGFFVRRRRSARKSA